MAKVEQQNGNGTLIQGGDYVDLHELSKGWKAAIARVQDPNFK